MYAELHAALALSFLEAAGLPEGAAAPDDMARHLAGLVALSGGDESPDAARLTRGGADESRGGWTT
jgi:hypothetical protein